MKIYYAAALKKTDEQSESFIGTTLPNEILSMGYSVSQYVYDPLLFESKVSFAQMIESIRQADVFIGEMSSPSQTLGFQLALALQMNKPSLYLYDESRHAYPDTPLAEHPSRLLKINTYHDLESAKAIIKGFLAYSSKQLQSTRTSFMSTKAVDEYIGDTAKNLGLTKSEIIRQLLDTAIENNNLKI